MFCYKLVSGAPETPPPAATPNDGAQQRLHTYLDWASSLLESHTTYCLLRYTPELVAKPFMDKVTRANWSYKVVANDFAGLGIDKGFEPAAAETDAGVSLLFRLSSPRQLKELPEDMFGDFSSQVSFFGLQNGREESITEFLSSGESPQLSDWLQPAEMFIHVAVGKEQGYYDAFLVKAGTDISRQLEPLY